MYNLHSFCLSSRELKNVWADTIVSMECQRVTLLIYRVCQQDIFYIGENDSDGFLIQDGQQIGVEYLEIS